MRSAQRRHFGRFNGEGATVPSSSGCKADLRIQPFNGVCESCFAYSRKERRHEIIRSFRTQTHSLPCGLQ